VQTYRQKEEGGTIFLEHVSETGTVRLVTPPQVAAVIARQREQLTAKTRSKAAKAVAQERKERGELRAFLKPKTEHGKGLKCRSKSFGQSCSNGEIPIRILRKECRASSLRLHRGGR